MDTLFQNYIPGIVASLIAAFIIWFIDKIITSIQEKSDFNGQWESCLYDDNSNIIKRDIVKIKHNKKTGWIHGNVKRNLPKEETYKEWKIEGLLIGKDIICLIWSKQSFVSLNCSYLRQIEGYEYEGFCLKNINENIEKYKVTLSKMRL